MNTYGRGQEIAADLEAMGTRAFLDPALASPPCVLVIPPNLTFDLACAVTAEWRLIALAPATHTADRGTWQALESILTNAEKVLDLQSAELVAYVVNGKSCPAYLLRCQEAI